MDTDAVLGALALGAVEGIGLYILGVLIAGGLGVIGTLLWGKGGRKRLVDSNKRLEKDARTLNERIAALEARLSSERTAQTINISLEKNGNRDADQSEQKNTIFHIAEGLPDGPDGEKRWRVGTVNGPMTVRLNHEKSLDDVLRILRANNVLASLSDEYEMDERREE